MKLETVFLCIIALMGMLSMSAGPAFMHVHSQVPYIPRIGMSGSFYTYSGLILPQGGVFNSSDLFIVVYNYGEEPANVTLTVGTVHFIHVYFEPNETNITLDPGEHRRIKVILRVDEDALPGEYNLSISASEVVKPAGGGPVVVVPAVTQAINISIVGEYSFINVYAVDPSGKPASTALVRLYMRFKGKDVSIMDSYNGELHAKVLPGNYTVRVYLAGELVAEENVTLAPYQNKTVTMTVKIVFIEFFSIQPVLNERQELMAAKLNLVVKNVYKTLEDVSIRLKVYLNGEEFDERELASSTVLPLGRTEYRSDYVPETGWKPGNYTFIVEVYGMGDKLLARSQPRWLYYQQPASPLFTYLKTLLPLLILLPLILIPLWRRRKKKKRKPHRR